MGLLKTLKGAVKIADKLTKDLQSKVYFRRYVSQGGDGEKTYDPPVGQDPVELQAIVEDKQEIVRTLSGELSQSKTHITFLDAAALATATGGNGVQEADKITLQNGETGRILAVAGFMDRETSEPLATEVYLG